MKVLPTLALAAGFAFALHVAACSDLNNTCASASAGASGCSETGANAGTSGSTSTACPQLTAIQSCLSSFCQVNGSTPFCTCYTRGFDLGTDCQCVTFDSAAWCTSEMGVDAAALDCSATTGSIASLCVPVQ